MVKHGSALPTAPIKLSSALTAVKVNAFVASPYPVILTIENHCNQKLQIIQAKMLREILGVSRRRLLARQSVVHDFHGPDKAVYKPVTIRIDISSWRKALIVEWAITNQHFNGVNPRGSWSLKESWIVGVNDEANLLASR